MKKKIGSMGVLLSFFVIIAFISGVVAFRVIYFREKTNEKLTEQPITQTIEQPKEEIQAYHIRELLDDANEVYLESYDGSTDIVEVNDQDVATIASVLRNLHLDNLKMGNTEINNYLYAIHIKDKNIKVKINNEYISVDNLQGVIQLFRGKDNALKNLTAALESIYMKKYNDYDVFRNAQQIYVRAMDEMKNWELDKNKRKALQDKIQLIAPINEDEAVGIPAVYPNYIIHIKINKQSYNMQLLTQEIVKIDGPNNVSYYQYDKKLWNYVKKEFPVEFDSGTDPLKTLIRAKKVVIDAADDNWDLEDHTYYHIEIPRLMLKAQKQEIHSFREEEPLMFTLYFTVDHHTEEVKIFANHIMYDHKVYYSENIGEAIQSLLNV